MYITCSNEKLSYSEIEEQLNTLAEYSSVTFSEQCELYDTRLNKSKIIISEKSEFIREFGDHIYIYKFIPSILRLDDVLRVFNQKRYNSLFTQKYDYYIHFYIMSEKITQEAKSLLNRYKQNIKFISVKQLANDLKYQGFISSSKEKIELYEENILNHLSILK